MPFDKTNEVFPIISENNYIPRFALQQFSADFCEGIYDDLTVVKVLKFVKKPLGKFVPQLSRLGRIAKKIWQNNYEVPASF